MNFSAVIERFRVKGEVLECRPMGHGHINRTYLVTTTEKEYTLQKINTEVFKDVAAIMHNIAAVTAHIAKKHTTIEPIATINGELLAIDDTGCYRMLTFVRGTVKEKASCPEDMYAVGLGFGRFQRDMSDFKGELKTIIPDFHNTPKRYAALLKSVEGADKERLNGRELLNKYLARADLADVVTKRLDAGLLPSRVTHNDTKINNLVLNADGSPLCAIDLDTVMPGSILYDFGDAVRTGGTLAAEDERDLSKIKFDLALYTAFLQGFCREAGEYMTDEEKRLLFVGAKLMTYECGMRFLTDYYDGDKYFSTAYEGHNLVRAAAQMALLEDMERHETEAERITYEFFGK